MHLFNEKEATRLLIACQVHWRQHINIALVSALFCIIFTKRSAFPVVCGFSEKLSFRSKRTTGVKIYVRFISIDPSTCLCISLLQYRIFGFENYLYLWGTISRLHHHYYFHYFYHHLFYFNANFCCFLPRFCCFWNNTFLNQFWFYCVHVIEICVFLIY